jgi:hypothetical protein
MIFGLRAALSVAVALGVLFLFNLGQQTASPPTIKFVSTLLVAVLMYFGAFAIVTAFVGRK